MKLWLALAVASGLCLSIVAGEGYAQSWSSMATISGTLGNNSNRLCVGAPSGGRPDIGCPVDAPSVMSGTLVADRVSATNISGSLIQIGAGNGVACDAARRGALRYSATSSTVEYCNSSAWVSVGPSSTQPVAFSALSSANQSIGNLSFAKVNFGNERFDTNNNFASSTFTVTVPGKYLFTAQAAIDFASPGTGVDAYLVLRKNGAEHHSGGRVGVGAGSSNAVYPNMTTVADAQAGDYFEVYAYQANTAASSQSLIGGRTSFSGALLAPQGVGGGGASNLSELGDVNTSGASPGNILAYNGSAWVVSSTVSASAALGDRITSGTLAMIANSNTSVVSLSTGGTTWGYLSSLISYLPRINAERVSSTLVSSTYVQLSSATDVLGCTAARAGTLRYVSGSLQLCDNSTWKGLGGVGQWLQVGRVSQNDLTTSDVIAFNGAIGNASVASLNTGTGRITLAAGHTYKLTGKIRIVGSSPAASFVSIAWYNHATTSVMGVGGVYITADTNETHSDSELAIAYLTPAVDTEVELRVLYVNQAGIDVEDIFGSVEVMMTGASNGGGGASSLGDLTDVSVAGASPGSILAYNGTSWVISTTASSVALGDRITSGTASVMAHENRGISTSVPMDVSGSVRVSGTLQLAQGAGGEVCGPGYYGTIRIGPDGDLEACLYEGP